MNGINRFYLLLAGLLSFSSTALADDCGFDDFPVMSEMRLYTVLGNAVHDNRPMMVKGFTADVSMAEVVAYYHKEWKDRYSDSLYGQWNQISTLTDDCLMTVQVAENGESSQGRIVISNVPKVSADTPLGEGVIKPRDANVVSDLVTSDGPKNGRVTILATGGLPEEVVRFYQASLPIRGWKLMQNFRKDDAHVLVYRRGLNTMNVLIMPAPEFTQVLINTETVN